VLGVIGGALGLMIGFLFWVTNRGLNDYTIVWSIIFLVFCAFLIIAFYFGGRNRIREEKRLIVEQQEKQEKMKSRSKPKQKDPYAT
jgi:cbb3-type cytochrome oxidase subunit 3